MSINKTEEVSDLQANNRGLGILEHSFSQLPAEGRIHLREYLKNLVSMQDAMSGADKSHPASKSE